MSKPDGLEALQAQRAKASARHAPPPRHVAPKKAKAAAEAERPLAPNPAPADPADALIRASIYLDGSSDEFLEDVRAAARRATPKVDASRSAIVRMALLRLADDLGPADVVAELRRRSASSASGTGRKRL